VGSKKNPIWRVVVADQRSPRDGRFIESIGRYNPQTHPSTIAIDEERLQHWLARGAQPTGTVKQLIKAQGKSGGAAVDEPPAAEAPEVEGLEADAVEPVPEPTAVEPDAAVPGQPEDAVDGEPASAREGEPAPGAEGLEADPQAAAAERDG
jgi:small subunit ribosomal protein S16